MRSTLQLSKVCLYLHTYKLVKNEIETERDEFSRCPEHVDHVLQQPQTRYQPLEGGRGVKLIPVLVGSPILNKNFGFKFYS